MSNSRIANQQSLRKDYPKVAIIILNWNSYDDTKECLKSLEMITYPNYEVIVVDNGSQDMSPSRLKNEFLDVHFIINKNNLGFARGCNLGIQEALQRDIEYILLLNNDTIVKSDFLEPAIQFFKNDGRVGIVGGKIYYYHDPDRIWSVGGKVLWLRGDFSYPGHGDVDHGQLNEAKEMDFVSGALMLISRVVLEKAGFLPEEYFFGYEDKEFCIRVARKGFKIFYVPNFAIFHKVGQSYKHSQKNLQIYNGYRNKLIFQKKMLSSVKWKLWYGTFFIYFWLLTNLAFFREFKNLSDKELEIVSLALSDHKRYSMVLLEHFQKVLSTTLNRDNY